MEDDQAAGNKLKTLNDVKALIGRAEYEKLTKGFDMWDDKEQVQDK